MLTWSQAVVHGTLYTESLACSCMMYPHWTEPWLILSHRLMITYVCKQIIILHCCLICKTNQESSCSIRKCGSSWSGQGDLRERSFHRAFRIYNNSARLKTIWSYTQPLTATYDPLIVASYLAKWIWHEIIAITAAWIHCIWHVCYSGDDVTSTNSRNLSHTLAFIRQFP